MEGLNRIIFLVLGLVAVVIFFAVLTGRINLKGRLPTFSDLGKKEALTPTPTPSKTAADNNKNSTAASQNQPYATSNQPTDSSKKITAIPATGASTLIVPISILFLTLGVSLKKWQ